MRRRTRCKSGRRDKAPSDRGGDGDASRAQRWSTAERRATQLARSLNRRAPHRITPRGAFPTVSPYAWRVGNAKRTLERQRCEGSRDRHRGRRGVGSPPPRLPRARNLCHVCFETTNLVARTAVLPVATPRRAPPRSRQTDATKNGLLSDEPSVVLCDRLEPITETTASPLSDLTDAHDPDPHPVPRLTHTEQPVRRVRIPRAIRRPRADRYVT